MKLLNLGAGSNRPQDEHWTNLDDLYEQFPVGTPERTNLDAEPRYVDHRLPQPLPFIENTFDGILCSHIIEHFNIHDAVKIMADCKRVLKPGGILVVSVPDAEYFLEVYDEDTKERAEELFGEPIHDEGHERFFTYALFNRWHKQVLAYDSLKCLFLMAGFIEAGYWDGHVITLGLKIGVEIDKVMNRRKFSLEMCGVK